MEPKMITEDQILAAFEEAGHEYLDMDDIVETKETLDDFKVSAQTWSECAEIHDKEYSGFKSVEFGGVQVNPGQPRYALTVIDFGKTRYAYKI
ncbi:MAG: hypothetical protein ABJO67_05220 [Pseudoruegeria sp.]